MQHQNGTHMWEEFSDNRAQEWEETCRQARRDADFHCQICNSRGPLFFHSRTGRRITTTRNVLVLCRECCDLAEMRLDQERSVFTRIVTNALFLLIIALISTAVFSLSPSALIGLCLACGCMAFLLEILPHAYKA